MCRVWVQSTFFRENPFTHLRAHEMGACPYENCTYSTNVSSSFNAPHSRRHGVCAGAEFFNDVTADGDTVGLNAAEPFDENVDLCEDLSPPENEGS